MPKAFLKSVIQIDRQSSFPSAVFVFLLIAIYNPDRIIFDGLLLSTSIFVMTWATMAISDVFDAGADSKHATKKLRPIPSGNISAKQVLFLAIAAYSFGVCILFSVGSLHFGTADFLILLSAALYSIIFKKFSLLAKPICVSFCLAYVLSIWPLRISFSQTNESSHVSELFYFCCLFFWSFRHELLKDFEDIENDKEFGVKTFVNTLGVHASAISILILNFCLVFVSAALLTLPNQNLFIIVVSLLFADAVLSSSKLPYLFGTEPEDGDMASIQTSHQFYFVVPVILVLVALIDKFSHEQDFIAVSR